MNLRERSDHEPQRRAVFMTATDSSELEPDLHHSESEPLEQASADGQTAGPTVESPDPARAESPKPAKAAGAPLDAAAGPGPAATDERPRATRVAEGAVLGGVCTGLARHLGWPVLVIRIGFVGLLLVQFLGAIAYGALWLLLPPEPEESAPGLEAASRSGMRTAAKPPRRIDWGSLLALAALATGLLWLVQTSRWGISAHLFWPVAFACAGAALVWRQADSSQQRK